MASNNKKDSSDFDQQCNQDQDCNNIFIDLEDDDDDEKLCGESTQENTQSSQAASSTPKEIFNHILLQCIPPKTFKFPKRGFGNTVFKMRACQHSWFDDFPWLHYDFERDFVLCYICTVASRTGRLKPKVKTFTDDGFSYWNDGKRKLEQHGQSGCHSDAVTALYGSKSQPKISTALNKSLVSTQRNNNEMLEHVVRALIFLTRQNLPLRGTYKVDKMFCEPDSNFNQLLLHTGHYNTAIAELLKKKQSFTSPAIQNKLISIMSNLIVEDIATRVNHANYYCIMVDETTDISNKEQMVLCLRYVDKDLVVKEDYISLSYIPNTSAETLYQHVSSELYRLGIPLKNCRGQCYDGAAAMSGAKNGLKTRIQEKNKLAIYIHCYGHALNLAVQDVVKLIPQVKDLLDTTYEVTKLVKQSPKREAVLARFKSEVKSSSSGIRTLCPTRWTVRADCLKSIIENYDELMTLWQESLDGGVSNTEMKARIIGVQSMMGQFDYVITLFISESVLRVTDNLSKALQGATRSASDGQVMARDTVKHLKTLRNEGSFEKLYSAAETLQQDLELSEPSLPRKRKRPARFDDADTAHQPTSVRELYRQVYYQIVDSAISAIKNRFNQPGLVTYSTFEQVLLKACQDNHTSPTATAITSN